MIEQQISEWMARDPDPETRQELESLQAAGDQQELMRRFGSRLSFGTAGLRGIVGAGPSRMNRLVVRETSTGLGTYVKDTIAGAQERGIVVGYDGRTDSRCFAEAAASVFVALGFRVYLGDRPLPTPVCAYAVRDLQAAAGIVVTASHNPPAYNGYKVYWQNGAQIIEPHDAAIAAAIDRASEAPLVGLDFNTPQAQSKIDSLGDGMIERYLAAIRGLSVRPMTAARKSFSIAYTPLHGVGANVAEEALRRAGFENIHTVVAQREPDGRFPTVNFPNPEEPGAMDAALALGRKVAADIVTANDPDADRLAVALPHPDGDFRMLTGDQVGILLGAELMEAADDRPNTAVATTIVSSSMLGVMAQAHGAQYRETLTGFKWIAEAAEHVEAAGGRFVFGYEEALGYTVGSVVRDKDGISALVVFCELAAALQEAGSSVWERLETLYRRYGLFVSAQKSLAINAEIQGPTLGERLRRSPPTKIGDYRVLAWADYLSGQRREVDGDILPLSMPPADVLLYTLEGDRRVIVRPSGTEPKLKCYYQLRSDIDAQESFSVAQQRAHKQLAALIDSHQQSLSDV